MNVPDLGEIQFYDHYLPGLEAGTYQIEVKHTIAVPEADRYDVKQSVVVRAPQFSLDPQLVHAVYPAAETQGQFEHVLPHVVLADRLLPWERKLAGVPIGTPWMALLVCSENELLPGDAGSNTRTTTRTVSDLLAPDPLVLKPNLPQVTGDDLLQKCRTIDLSSELFLATIPRPADLPYLAHCRQVDTANQANGKSGDNDWFSVVVANRFPAAPATGQAGGIRNLVHLISLEGYEAYLSGTVPFPRVDNDPSRAKTIRMVSLASWLFTCQSDDLQTFTALAQLLAGRRGLLRLPVPTPSKPASADPTSLVRQRLADGYVALSYHTSTGQNSFAWYRGPFSPVLSDLVEKTGPYSSASGATIFDRASGAFDLSLAAAWQIGRSLALRDATFARHLLAFRRAGHRLIDLLLERLHTDHLDTPADLQELLRQNLVEQKFLSLLRANLPERAQSQAQANAIPLATSRVRRTTLDPVQELRELLARPDVGTLLAQTTQDDLAPIALWLARLMLLYNVPFEHLLPNPALLPTDSIRFFYLDLNWLEALVDGALSAGVQTSRDTLYQGLIRDTLQQAALVEMQALRDHTRGTETGKPTVSNLTALSGVLVRSSLISGWPGLTVDARQNGQALKILRMDRLAPDVLLCLFLDVPDTLALIEPQQGLRFGVDDAWNIALRSLNAPLGTPTGKLLNTQNYRRAQDSRVLDMGALVGATRQILGLALGPADLAIQMVLLPEQALFSTPGGFPESSTGEDVR
ncbi:MAG TPA: hypothetical protein VF458_03700 [Ktedonobacteraceae bacterium]